MPTKEQFNFIKQGMIGGASFPSKKLFVSSQYGEVVGGKVDYLGVTDCIKPLDINGLYSKCMDSYDYPCGHPHWVLEGSSELCALQAHLDNDRLGELPYGYFKISMVPNTSLITPIFPAKKFEFDDRNGSVFSASGLDWNLLPSVVVASNVDVWRMKRAGYGVTLLKALVYPNHWSVFHYFISKARDLKAKYNKDEKTVLRNTMKLVANGLFGKAMENPILEESMLIYTRASWDKFLAENFWNDIVLMSDPNRTPLIQGTKKDVDAALVKPYQLGPMVTSWARWIMDFYRRLSNPDEGVDPVASLENTEYYIDTDCLHIRQTDPKAFEEKWKGQIEDTSGKMWWDLKGGEKVIRAIYLAPKCYILEHINKDNKIGYKQRARSLKAKFLTWKDYEDCLFERKRWRDGEVKQKMDIMKKTGASDANIQGVQHTPFEVLKMKIERQLSAQAWKGRQFFSNFTSVPIGFRHPLFEQLISSLPST